MIIVDVFVAGSPKTKGSMELRNGKTGAMKESVIGSSSWRALMAAAVRDDIARRMGHPLRHLPRVHCYRSAPHEPHGWADALEPVACWGEPAQRLLLPAMPYPAAVAVTVAAYLPPPQKGLFHWPIWNQAGDLDKLVRNVLDALGSKSKNPKYNGGAIVDDNLVCKLSAEKHSAEGLRAGVQIKVETL